MKAGGRPLLRVNIERLSIEGGTRARAQAVADTLRRELARLLSDEAALARLRQTPPMDSRPPQPVTRRRPELPAREGAERTGIRIAAHVADLLLSARTPR